MIALRILNGEVIGATKVYDLKEIEILNAEKEVLNTGVSWVQLPDKFDFIYMGNVEPELCKDIIFHVEKIAKDDWFRYVVSFEKDGIKETTEYYEMVVAFALNKGCWKIIMEDK